MHFEHGLRRVSARRTEKIRKGTWENRPCLQLKHLISYLVGRILGGGWMATKITVIGGGFTGAAAAIQLLGSIARPFDLTIIKPIRA